MKKLCLAALLLMPFTISAQQIPFESETYTLEADQVSRIADNIYEAQGNVILKFRDIEFNADKLTYNSADTSIEAEGNVLLMSPDQEFKAEKMSYNIKEETGTAENIQGFLAPFNYLCAKSMEKTGPTTFSVVDAKISTCYGKVPDWSISMHNGSMELGGYMHINHATANVLDTPFIYVPKFFYPVSTERQTGLLMPILGYDTDMGAVANIRYFIAPDINYDFTIGVGLYSERGVQEQLEARFALNDKSRFYMAGEHLKDFDSESNTKSRWRGTLANQYSPVNNLFININGDYVSDYLYSRDFEDYGISSYNKENYQNMYFAEAKIKYYHDYIDTQISYRRDMQYRDRSNGYTSAILESQPSFGISKIVKDIPYVFLEYDLSYDRLVSTKNDYYSNDTDPYLTQTETDWVMNRFAAYGKLYAPIDLKAATMTPALYIGYVRWENSSVPFSFQNYTSPDFGGVYRINDKSAYKYYGGAELTFNFKEIYRNFSTFRHSIQNNIILEYSPELDQSGLPNLIKDDRNDYKGSINYEFINSFIGKNWLMTLKLEQGYDVLKGDNAILPLEMKFNIRLFNYFTNITEMYFKHSGPLKDGEKRFQYFTNTMKFKFLKYFFLTGIYTYDTRIYRNSVASNAYNTRATIGAGINIWRFALVGSYEWMGYNDEMSFNNLIPKERSVYLLYNAECWSLGAKAAFNNYEINSIDGKYARKEAKFYIMFSLKGLGDSSIEFFNLNH